MHRFDNAELLAEPQRTPEGWLRAQGILTRTGVFEYPEAGGRKRRELRPAEEVFAPDAMRSFALNPVTLHHPPKLLTAETARGYAVGAIGMPDRVGDKLRAEILITDESAVRAAENGVNQLSCGYMQTPVFQSGVYTDPLTGVEEPFDVVQTNIRGNHIALTDDARAGEAAQIRMDSADGYGGARKDNTTMKIKIGGVEYEVPDALMAALTPEQKTLLSIEVVAADADEDKEPDGDPPEKKPDERADEDKPDADDKEKERMDSKKLRAELDALKGKLAVLETKDKKDQQTAAEQARMDAQNKEVADRINLLAIAAPILAKSKDNPDGKAVADLARMDSNAIRAAVVAKEQPKIDLKGKSVEYVTAAFDTIMSSRVDSAASLAQLIADGSKAAADQVRTDANDDPIRKAQAAMVERMTSAWKTAEAGK